MLCIGSCQVRYPCMHIRDKILSYIWLTTTLISSSSNGLCPKLHISYTTHPKLHTSHCTECFL